MKKIMTLMKMLLLCSVGTLVGCTDVNSSTSILGGSNSTSHPGSQINPDPEPDPDPDPDPEPTNKAPNIVTILVDDMGFSDLGCYGSEIHTPNIDSLAKHGVRFNQFYNTARCCPSRASLLTGLSPHQAGVGHMVDDNNRVDAYSGTLNKKCVTIPEVLKSAGYSTYMSGKWHVSKNTSTSGDKSAWPMQRGFDKFYGILKGSTSYWNPETLMNGNDPISSSEYLTKYPSENVPDTYYLTDAISDASVTYIEEHQKQDNPYFLYVAYTAPHWPMEAPQENIDHYDGVYDAGWDEIRQARYEKQLELGIIDESTKLTSRPSNVKSWDSYTGDKELQALTMSKYAACIERMDQGVGKILDAIDKSGEADNTIVMFLSDNGGCAELGTYATDVNPNNYRYPAIGEAWANVANTPFVKYKHYMSEGGIAAPFIVRWPSKITGERRGSIEKTPGSIVDIMATCVDVSDATYPDVAHGNVIPHMEGKSLANVLTGGTLDDRYICAEHEGNAMVRNNKWKLIRQGEGQFDVYNTAWKLYDMENDRSETNNLASQYPDIVDELASAWNQWAIRCDVFPMYSGDGTGKNNGFPTSLDGQMYYSLTNKANSNVLQHNHSASEDENVGTVGKDTIGLGQQWALVDAGDGYLQIRNRINKLCLQDTSTSDAGGNIVTASEATDADEFKWKKIDTSGNYFKLENKKTGKVLAYYESSSGATVRTVANSSGDAVYWIQAKYNNQNLNELVYYIEKTKTIREEMYSDASVTKLKEASEAAYQLVLSGAKQADITSALTNVKNCFNSLAIEDGKATKSYVIPNGRDFFNANDWKSADSSGTSRTRDQIIDKDGNLTFSENTASRLELFHVIQDSNGSGSWRHPGTPANNLANATAIYGKTYSYEMKVNPSGQFDFLVLGGTNCYSMNNHTGPGIFFRFTEDKKVTLYASKSSAAADRFTSWGEFSGTADIKFKEENTITFNLTRVDADTLVVGLTVNGTKVSITGTDSDGMFSSDNGSFKAVGYTTSSNSLGQRCGFYPGTGKTVLVTDLKITGVN